jgi:hypothetical protein
LSVAASVFLIYTARDRIVVDLSVSNRFPGEAFAFVEDAGVAKRSLHTIGFGSYMIWDLYPKRQAFIDGRHLSAGLHEDLLAAQTHTAGFNGAIRKYDLDAFILPAPERSDGGMRRLHEFLIAANGRCSLVHIDPIAYVYVVDHTVPAAWLAEHAYRVYHPMTFARLPSLPIPDQVAAELARAQAEAPEYTRVLLDSGRFYGAIGRWADAVATVDRALVLDPANAEAQWLRKRLTAQRQR